MKFLRLSLLVFFVIVLVSEGCASQKRRNNKQPCDCPEFDNKPKKRKKRSELPKEKIWYWNDSFVKQNVA